MGTATACIEEVNDVDMDLTESLDGWLAKCKRYALAPTTVDSIEGVSKAVKWGPYLSAHCD